MPAPVTLPAMAGRPALHGPPAQYTSAPQGLVLRRPPQASKPSNALSFRSHAAAHPPRPPSQPDPGPNAPPPPYHGTVPAPALLQPLTTARPRRTFSPFSGLIVPQPAPLTAGDTEAPDNIQIPCDQAEPAHR